MISTYSALALMLASQTLASPVLKRQAVDTVTTAVPAPSSTMQPQDTAVVTETVPPPTPTAGGDTDTDSDDNDDTDNRGGPSAYPCPEGYLLTYAEAQMNYTATLPDLVGYAGNFQNASYFGYLNGTGGNEVGAERYLVSGRREVLTEYENNFGNIAVQVGFNLTNGPVDVGNDTQFSNYSTVLQVFQNSTATGDEGASTVKLFSNFCSSDQDAGREIQRDSFDQALMNIQRLINGEPLVEPTGPVVTATVSATETAVAPTETLSQTAIAEAPTVTSSTSLTADANTVTASETITPEIVTDTISNTITPEASTAIVSDTVTPEASTQVASTTVTPEASTVTASTTINPLATQQGSESTATVTTTTA